MSHKFLLSFTLILGVALTGCTITPSKPLTFDQLGQFSAYPLNAQSYRIDFQARSNISYGTAEEITLLKAAQTTIQNGYRYFKVQNDPSNRAQKPPRQAVVYPSPMYSSYSVYHRNPYYWRDPFFDQPRLVNVDPIQVSYTIECYKDQSNQPSDAFDATLILKSLGQKYGIGSNGQVLTPSTAP